MLQGAPRRVSSGTVHEAIERTHERDELIPVRDKSERNCSPYLGITLRCSQALFEKAHRKRFAVQAHDLARGTVPSIRPRFRRRPPWNCQTCHRDHHSIETGGEQSTAWRGRRGDRERNDRFKTGERNSLPFACLLTLAHPTIDR